MADLGGDVEVDVAVVGLGIMGSCTLWRLAARGISAIGIDTHHPPHQFGQSKGESRILRRIQFEGEDYVALGSLAYQLWSDMARQGGHEVFRRTGLLVLGPPGSQLIRGGRESAERAGLDFDLLDAAAIRARHPQHLVGDEEIALFDPDGGYASPDQAVETALRLAADAGATTRLGCTVRSISAGAREVVLKTDRGTIRCVHAVVAAGARLPSLLPEFAAAIQHERHGYAYVKVTSAAAAAFAPDRFPVWIRENSSHTGVSIRDSHSHRERILAFGFPTLDGSRVKVGFPDTGAVVPGPEVDPKPWPAEAEVFGSDRLKGVLAGVVPGYSEFTACQYDNSRDFNFILGQLPSNPRVTVLGGFSGHGFKHAPAVGECAAALAAGEAPPLDIRPYSPARAALGLRS